MNRLLITGAGGFVGGSILAQAPGDCVVHAFSRTVHHKPADSFIWHQGDLSDPVRMRSLFEKVKPTAVIHAAALADIDTCQSHPEEAERINVEATRTLSAHCAETHAKLVFLSTDTVFDGENAPYGESDPPDPVNFYGQTKVRAETVVSDLSSPWAIARLSLVIGLPVLGAGNSFLAKMLATLAKGDPVSVPGNEIRTPVDVLSLGRALLELATGGEEGIFHLSGNDSLPRFAMAQRIAKAWGFAENLVIRKDSEALPGRAPRPRDVSLDNSRARQCLKTPLLGLDDAIRTIQTWEREHH